MAGTNDYLKDYLHYAAVNEAPEMFHVWASYFTLSSAVSRKVWLPFGDAAIFPNVYCILVGDAGDGKTTAMKKAKRILDDALPLGQTGFAGVSISGEIETPPGLWRFMAGQPKKLDPQSGKVISEEIKSPVKYSAVWPDGVARDVHPMTIIANEFIDFISIDDAGWINGLNNIYDSDRYHYRTKGQGEDILLGPYIVMLGGLTTQVSQSLQKANIISTGLARRTIFQYGQRKFHTPMAILRKTDTQGEAYQRCHAHLKRLNSLTFNGPFVWQKPAEDFWVEWYNEHSSHVLSRTPQTKSWFTSKPDQVLKIAMLSALGEYDLELVLRKEHLELALHFFTILEEDLMKIFGGSGRNELAAVAQKIGEFVQFLPYPIQLSKLKQQFFASCKPPNDFDQCIEYLVGTDQIKRAGFQVRDKWVDIVGTAEVLEQVKQKLQDPEFVRTLAAKLGVE